MKTLLRLSMMITISILCFLHGKGQETQDSIRIDLNKALEIALSENPTMRIAGRDIEVKKNYKREQIVSLFPDVSLSAGYNRNLKKQMMAMEMQGTVVEIEVGTDNTYNAGLSLTLPIIAPALWNNVKLSQLDVELAMESARASKISLINEVKKAYYNLLLAKDSYLVLLKNYQNVEDNFQNIAAKYEQGLASEFDKLRAEVQVKNQIPNLKSAASGVDLATMMLKVLMGVSVNEPLLFEGSLSDYESLMTERSVPKAGDLSLENNTDLHQLDLSIAQLNRSLSIIKSSAAPTLAFTGALQLNSMNDDFNFAKYKWYPYAYVGVGLNVPIVSWASTSYRVKSSKLNIQSLEDQRNYLEENLRLNINNALNQINNATEELESNRENVKQAEKAQSISQKQYEIGMGTWLDLSAAEVALTSARLAYTQSIYNYLTAYADLERILGNN